MEELKKLSQPQYFGPGVWFCIHNKAAKAKNYNDVIEAIKFMEMILDSLKCENCRKHASEYLKNNPPRYCLDCKHENHEGGVERCFFDWTCNFHNKVNFFLKKPIIECSIAYKYYSENEFEVCDTDCGENKNDKYENKVDKTIPPSKTFYSNEKSKLRLAPRRDKY